MKKVKNKKLLCNVSSIKDFESLQEENIEKLNKKLVKRSMMAPKTNMRRGKWFKLI